MATVQRGNVILTVDNEDLDYYVGNGYDIIDASGHVLTKAEPKDINSLTKFYREGKEKIAELEVQVKKLIAENESLKVELANAKKAPKTTKSTKETKSVKAE